MAIEFKAVGNSARSGISVGDLVPASVNKRGELVAMPWAVQLAAEGRVFSAGGGTESTPVTGGNTVVDLDQPEFLLRVPAGTAIVPLHIHFLFEATGGTIAEGGASIADNDPGSGTSTAADRTPKGLSTISAGSACTAAQLVTANLTLTNNREIWRFGEPTDLDATNSNNGFEWSYLKNPPMVLYGPAALLVYGVAGTSSTFYVTVTWAEFLTSDLK